MNANQQVQYRKLIGYLSPYDSLKINHPEYKQLKRRTTENQMNYIENESNNFILQQLGSPVSRKHRYSQSRLPTSTNRPNTRKDGNNQLQTLKSHGRSNSAQILPLPLTNSVPSIQLSRIENSKRINNEEGVLTQNNSSTNTPINSSRNKNSQLSPSNFKKRNLVTLENESQISLIENNNNQSKRMSQNLSNLNISNIVENFNLSKSAIPNQILSKSIVYQEPVKYAWSEIKFKGKLCEGRSFSQAVVYNNSFYFYGGYDASKGVYKDFKYLTFSQTVPSQFHDVDISPDNKVTPGRLCRHGAILRGTSMIIFGGRTSSIQSSNGMYEYSFTERVFNRLIPRLQSEVQGGGPSKTKIKEFLMPTIDSHSMIYDEKKDQLIVSGGFLGDRCQYCIDIYTYSFKEGTWTLIKPSSDTSPKPEPRGAHGSVLKENKLFIYGGSDGENIFEDMWYFDMETLLWKKVDYSNQSIQPGPRSGIQIIEYEGYFVIFGGFKSLINERNDLAIFDSRKFEWVYQSERKEIVEVLQTNSVPPSPSRKRAESTSKNSSMLISNKILSTHRYGTPMDGKRMRNFSTHSSHQSLKPQVSGQSRIIPLQQKDEINELILKNRDSKYKVNNEKKMQLLKQFEVPEDIRRQLLSPIPILQSMKSSLHLLSTCNKSHKYDQINQIQQKTQNFQNTESKIKGKHPGARDGYLAAVMGEKLIIFGGDRHRMSLNDTYELDIKMILNYIKKI